MRLAAKNWVKNVEIQLAAKTDQTKIGRRPQVMPGARILTTVTMKFRPPRMELTPNVMMLALKRIWPDALRTDSGG